MIRLESVIELKFVKLILLLKLDQQFPVEQFEATVSQSTVPGTLPSPYITPLNQDLVWLRYTPSPPIKSFPIKSPWVKLSGRLPIKFNAYDSSHPL